MPHYGLIIPAAGKGLRFGKKAKVLTMIQGLPLIIHTCRRFELFQEFKACVIATDPESRDEVAQALKLAKIQLPYIVIEGGASRYESVRKAVDQLRNIDKVCIHDAARPNCPLHLIQSLIAASKNHAAVIPGVPVVNTIKRVHNGIVVETPTRAELVAVQTPQIFDYTLLKKAYQHPDLREITDESMLIEALGEPVHVIPGAPENIKVTHPNDIPFIEQIWNS